MKMVVDVHAVIRTMLQGLRGPGEDPHAQQRRQPAARSTSAPSRAIPRRARSAATTPAATSWPTTRRPARPRTSASPQTHHGIISVTPDEERGVAYISTCSDDGRPIEHSHFMVLDLKTRKYRDLGDMRAHLRLHRPRPPGPGLSPGARRHIVRYDPETDKLERLERDHRRQAAAARRSRKDGAHPQLGHRRRTARRCGAVEMTTNALYSFDLTGEGGDDPRQARRPACCRRRRRPTAGRCASGRRARCGWR